MLNSEIRAAGIIGTGSYLPDIVLTNGYFEERLDTSDEWIVSRTGIRERRKADDCIAASDMATYAALKAIEDANVAPEDIDMIIVATVTPDMLFPSTACIVQKNIGAINASAFDISAACSGFIYGLSIAEKFIKAGNAKYILVIGAEALSKITDYSDRNTCILFGDGAGAAVVAKVEESMGILAAYTGSDGRGGELLKLPAGGSRLPASCETIKNSLHFVKMDGSEVFKFAIKIMGEAAEKALEMCGLNKEDIDYLIPHQANIRIIESATKRLKIPQDKVFINIDKYGNMSAASIAVALDEANKAKKLNKGDIVVLVGFGGGLTWGAVVLKWA
ncbi:3-oxoacyl-[acyl-carrier-protein] synthase-3 [Lutispora thermophila DSM 19022]|uniref:Beta-ketoacyl-[acyl-carrier-protein] synthase III n=2 Tax=Lutispora TaxID=667112 RepID=A0A1M6G4H0_9FIRM|nr:beta-ketoacyl-ACP synthase III [Lutispora thermophila]SHJ04876.1 3-oxoacyl-[acyl-carrier-protein] synthase-3 [Lutispora thermophila DSM 19022]